MRRRPKYYGSRVKWLHCGTIIESRHVHDFVFCKCKDRHKGISIDGGGEYMRMIGCHKSKFKVTREGNCKCKDRHKGISIDGGGEYMRMIGCHKSKFKVTREGNYAIDDATRQRKFGPVQEMPFDEFMKTWNNRDWKP